MSIKEKKVWDFDKKLINLPMKNVSINAYACSFRYFQNISHWLYHDYLSYFNRHLHSKAIKFIKSSEHMYRKQHMKEDNSSVQTVCLHVRRGDKATKFAHDSQSFRIPNQSDIHKAMTYMEEKFEQVIFFIASDGKDWCIKHLKRDNVFISDFGSYQLDFVLVSSCNHMIMTVGTFSWWAAWLTHQRGGTVLYFKYPFVNGSKKDKDLNRKNHFLPGWIPYSTEF